MKNAANCRLGPLVPCIQEFSQVYGYIVLLLYKLHSCKIIYTSSAVPDCKFFLTIQCVYFLYNTGCPTDTLEGHNLRFLKQFKALKQFYLQSSTLKYFKPFKIQVPEVAQVIGKLIEHQLMWTDSYINVESAKFSGVCFRRHSNSTLAESSQKWTNNDPCGYSSTRTFCTWYLVSWTWRSGNWRINLIEMNSPILIYSLIVIACCANKYNHCKMD